MTRSDPTRRQFLARGSDVLLGGVAGSMAASIAGDSFAAESRKASADDLVKNPPKDPLIERVQLDTIRSGYDKKYCWVQARAGAIPRGKGDPTVIMTMQTLLLSGSDVFGPLNEMEWLPKEKVWMGPFVHENLGRRKLPGGIEINICDFTPSWHAKTHKLLGVGHTVRYRNDKEPLFGARETAYSVYDARETEKKWSDWDIVRMPDGDKTFYHSGSGSAQRVDLPNGDTLVPIYFSNGSQIRKSAVMRCTFDGTKLKYAEHGNAIDIPTHRGALEPSLTKFGDRFLLTIRHGDGHGYVAVSKDGLHFEPHQRWRWDDGKELETGDTQQHWVTHSDGLYLAFTYKRSDNKHVFRHRAPLFMARVDPEKLTLARNSLRVLVPERGARLGNFAVVNVGQDETWVTVAEWMQPAGCEKYGSDNSVYAARIVWSKRNRLMG